MKIAASPRLLRGVGGALRSIAAALALVAGSFVLFAPYFPAGAVVTFSCGVLPFILVERVIARIKRHDPERPRVALLAYAHHMAGVGLFWRLSNPYPATDLALVATMASVALIVSIYGAIGRRAHPMLAIAGLVVLPLFWIERHDPHRTGIKVMGFSPLQAFLLVIVPLTALFWYLEYLSYRQSRRRTTDAGDGSLI
jgi:hypothetical protein